MPDPAKLLELAARCEGYAPTGYRDLDVDSRRSPNEEIAAAIGMKLTVKVGDPILGNERMVPSRLPDFIGSLDAAMTLVPEGSTVHCIGESQFLADQSRPWLAMVVARNASLAAGHTCHAATPALALTAASLRALAAKEGE